MKSILIVVALCSLLLISSGFSPGGIRAFSSISPAAVAAPADTGRIRAAGRSKAGKLPRWHRVIPGMFR